MEIRRCSVGDELLVGAARDLFDSEIIPGALTRFLADDRHHMLIAYLDGEPAGFVSGVEMTHPDKGTEMLLYELSVGPGFRRRGVGSALSRRLSEVAAARGCYGMWALTDADNTAARSTYASAGAALTTTEQVMYEWDRLKPSSN